MTKKWYEDNKERLKLISKKYYLDHRDEMRNSFKARYESKKEEVIASRKIYREANHRKIITSGNEYCKKRRKQDPSFRIAGRLRARMGKAIRGLDKSASTFQLIGINPRQLKSYIESQFTEGMTWDNIHIDHIIPCSIFDMTKELGQRICFHYLNLRPMMARDNIIKKDKLTDEACSLIRKISIEVLPDKWKSKN